MTKDDKPLNGPLGNRDADKRGRGISGRDSRNQAQTPKSGDGSTSRHVDETDTDGYGIG